MLASQGIGFIGTLLVLVLSAEPLAAPDSLAWGAIAGVCGVGGLGFFYYALSRGTMGLVAPLAALIGAGLPVLLAIAGGEQPDTWRLAGIGLALVAVVLISIPTGDQSTHERRAARIDLADLPLVILSGLGFAGFFIAIDKAAETGAMWWPLAMVRLLGISM